MNRINSQGMELLSYKEELGKDYPEIVRKSMILALEQMQENEVLDLDTYNLVVDKNVSKEELSEFLLTNPLFRKSEEEIFAEFEVIRKKINETFEKQGLTQLSSESLVNKDQLLITKKYCINEQFALDYFSVEEKDLLKLMKRRGFIEKFSVLRLTAIFNRFMEELQFKSELLNFDVSLVYFDKEENGYSIDIQFELPIEVAEKEEHANQICNTIKEVVEKADEYYKLRVIV